MNIELNPEKIIEQAASRLADEAYDSVNAMEMLENEISRRIDSFLTEKTKQVMEDVLRSEMEGLMVREFSPVNQWGEATGETTNLRAELQKRAAEFWNVKVDKNGKPSGAYSGKPRHQQMYENIAKEIFAEAVKSNIDDVIIGFRDALRKDAGTMLGEHIERFIKAPKRR